MTSAESPSDWFLLHAAAANAASLRSFAERLTRESRRLQRINLPLDASAGPLLEGYLRQTIEALEAADRPVVLFGHSMGGLVALLCALAGAPVARLILYEPIVLGLLREDVEGEARARAWDADVVRRFREALVEGKPEAGAALFVEAMGELKWPAMPPPAREHLRRHASQLLGLVESVSRYPLDEGRLQRCAVPTLILQGADSMQLTQLASARLAQCLPSASRIMVPGCGHLGPVMNPGAVVTAIESQPTA